MSAIAARSPGKPAPTEGLERPELMRSGLALPAMWIAATKIAAFAVNVALPLVLVRRLNQHDFGLYKQVFLIVGTIITTLPLNFAMSALYFLGHEPEKGREFVFNIAAFYALVAGGAALAVYTFPSLVAWMSGSDALRPLVPELSLVVLFWVFSAFLEVLMIANRDFRAAGTFLFVAPIARSLLLIAAVVAFGTLDALLLAAICYGVVQTAWALVYLRRRFPSFWLSFRWPTLRAQASYILPLSAVGLLWTVMTDLHSYWVSIQFGPAAFAVYSIGCFQLPLVAILSESVAGVVIPQLSALQRRGDHREVVRATIEILRSLAFIHFALYAFLMVCGRVFLTVLFTDAYAESWPIFAVNLTMLPVNVVMLDPIVRAYPQYRYFLLRVRLLFIVLLIALLWIGTVQLGMLGAILAMVIAMIGERVLLMVKIAADFGITAHDKEKLRETSKIAAAAALAGVLTLIGQSLLTATAPLATLVVCAALFGLAYLGAIVLLGVVRDEDMSRLRAILARVRA
jgi:O-antigen/teichoic acid export membrane protein